MSPELNTPGISKEDQERLVQSGINLSMENRCGSYLQMNQDVVHAECHQEGIEVLSYKKAMEKYDWLEEYNWKAVSRDKDDITKYSGSAERPERLRDPCAQGLEQHPPDPGLPLPRTRDDPARPQYHHRRRRRRLHIISGCTSGGHVGAGAAHYGVSEFYIKKNAKVSFTMIHTWTENIEVFPRSASIVEENGVFLSNYVCMQPVKKIQMYPVATLKGENSVARFSTITIASPTSYFDVGSRAILEGKGSSAELVTRAITRGGTIISRGNIQGKTAGTRGHLECKGLILKDGRIYAIPGDRRPGCRYRTLPRSGSR